MGALPFNFVNFCSKLFGLNFTACPKVFGLFQ
jgi:hypothetical protein